MKRLLYPLCVAMLVFAALGATLAVAKTSYPSQTTAQITAKTIEGKISSSKAACLKNRAVTINYADLGGRYRPVQTTSDGSGNWSVPFAADPSVPGAQAVIAVGDKKVGGITCLGTTKHIRP